MNGLETEHWCGSCHSPVFPAFGKAEWGVNCIACHAMRGIPEPTGNGRAVYAPPAEYPFGGSGSGSSWLHGFMLRIRPAPHVATLGTPASFRMGVDTCIPCHRQSVTVAQNEYKFMRCDDTYGTWLDSAWSGDSIHTAGTTANPKTCVDCHMPASGPEGSVHPNHSCLRSYDRDSAIASAPRPRFNVEVFALRRGSGTRERVEAPLSARTTVVEQGETVEVDVLVSMEGVGHAFPAGGSPNHDVRLGAVIEGSDHGAILACQADGYHEFGLKGLDRNGLAAGHSEAYNIVAIPWRTPTDTGQRPATRTGQQPVPPYNALIPGQPEVVRFRVTIPRGVRGPLRLHTSLTDRAVRPRAEDKSNQMPSQHQVILGQATALLYLRGDRDTPRDAAGSGQREDTAYADRFHQYGLALLAQNDLPRARRALQQALSLTPNRPEYLIAMGRLFLQYGDLLAAKSQLEEAIRLSGGSPRASAWLGRTFRLMGQCETALRILNPLAERFPRDSQTWLDIGLSLSSLGRVEDAATAFTRMLEIDPDDASAHLNLMLCYRRLRKLSLARLEEGAWRALREEAPPQTVMDAYLRRNPNGAREMQSIHTHTLVPVKSQ